MAPQNVGYLLKSAYAGWTEHKAARLGAALAYYTIFSLAPLLVVAIAVASIVFGEAAARTQITTQIATVVGPQAAQSIQDMVRNASKHGSGVFPTVLGIVTILLGASGVFGQLQDSMNTIWDVQPVKTGGLWKVVKERFLSFSMVLGTCFLLLISLVVSAAIASVAHYMHGGPNISPLLQVLDLVVGTAVITLLFALLFKFLPETAIAWHDVWAGALVTAILFSLGKLLLGLYLTGTGVSSAYGAAGSLVVILVWVYYTAQILFFGAELTKAYTFKYGSRAKLTEPAH